jgi:hypothetical protein
MDLTLVYEVAGYFGAYIGGIATWVVAAHVLHRRLRK